MSAWPLKRPARSGRWQPARSSWTAPLLLEATESNSALVEDGRKGAYLLVGCLRVTTARRGWTWHSATDARVFPLWRTRSDLVEA